MRMKRTIAILGGIWLMSLAPGCGDLKTDTTESVMGDMTALLSQVSDDLGRVQDAKAAEEVRPKVRSAWERWQSLEGRLAAAKAAQIRPPSTQVMKTADSQLRVSRKLFLTQWRRIDNAEKRPWGQPLVEEFKDFIVAVSGVPAEEPREVFPSTLDATPDPASTERKLGTLERRERLR